MPRGPILTTEAQTVLEGFSNPPTPSVIAIPTGLPHNQVLSCCEDKAIRLFALERDLSFGTARDFWCGSQGARPNVPEKVKDYYRKEVQSCDT